jgi:hypothetical protein
VRERKPRRRASPDCDVITSVVVDCEIAFGGDHNIARRIDASPSNSISCPGARVLAPVFANRPPRRLARDQFDYMPKRPKERLLECNPLSLVASNSCSRRDYFVAPISRQFAATRRLLGAAPTTKVLVLMLFGSTYLHSSRPVATLIPGIKEMSRSSGPECSVKTVRAMDGAIGFGAFLVVEFGRLGD